MFVRIVSGEDFCCVNLSFLSLVLLPCSSKSLSLSAFGLNMAGFPSLFSMDRYFSSQ